MAVEGMRMRNFDPKNLTHLHQRSFCGGVMSRLVRWGRRPGPRACSGQRVGLEKRQLANFPVWRPRCSFAACLQAVIDVLGFGPIHNTWRPGPVARNISRSIDRENNSSNPNFTRLQCRRVRFLHADSASAADEPTPLRLQRSCCRQFCPSPRFCRGRDKRSSRSDRRWSGRRRRAVGDRGI